MSNFEDCIKDNHLVVSAYYKDSEIPDKGKPYYSVALPIKLYAGIELHADSQKGCVMSTKTDG